MLQGENILRSTIVGRKECFFRANTWSAHVQCVPFPFQPRNDRSHVAIASQNIDSIRPFERALRARPLGETPRRGYT